MRLVINTLATLGARTGIGHYVHELLACLRKNPGVTKVTEYPDRFIRKLCEFGTPPGPSAGPAAPPRLWPRVRRRLVEAVRPMAKDVVGYYARFAYARQLHDIYHEPNYVPLAINLPTVATVHDLSVLLHPEWHPPERVAYFEKHFRKGLERCRHFLAISESARQEIIRTLNIPPERITRTYMGVRPCLRPLPAEEVRPVLKQLGLPPRYLLYLGTVEPRKNVLRLLRAYCALPEAARSQWPLLLAGGWGWRTEDVAAFYESEARHRGVLHVGYLPEEHLAAVYSGARALVFPSFYEGFGLPPIEMMACGGAVIASTAPALVETVGRKACLIDPEDTGGWRDALLRVVSDDDWWGELRRGAEDVARPYTWEACARDTFRAYEIVLRRRSRAEGARAA